MILALLCASCVTEDKYRVTEADKQVRAAFENWRTSVLENNYDIFFWRMTPRMRTLYLWHMIQGGNTDLFRNRMPELSEGDRTDFETWLGINATRDEDKVDLLPISILRGTWLKGMIHDHFKIIQQDLAFELAQVRVVQIYTEGAGSTVIVRNIRNKNEWYSMVFDGEGWKIDGHRLAH